jgi:hypothetical protein
MSSPKSGLTAISTFYNSFALKALIIGFEFESSSIFCFIYLNHFKFFSCSSLSLLMSLFTPSIFSLSFGAISIVFFLGSAASRAAFSAAAIFSFASFSAFSRSSYSFLSSSSLASSSSVFSITLSQEAIESFRSKAVDAKFFV